MRILNTDKTDNLTCEIIYDNFPCENYRFSNNYHAFLWIFYIARKDCILYDKQNNTYVLGNAWFISRVKHNISLVCCAHS